MTSQRNKPRLLLALYARPKYPESYHYALLITPKITAAQNAKSLRATKYHVKNTVENIKDRISQPWRFERAVIDDINLEPWLLACVVIGKVVSQEQVERVFGETPVYQVDNPDKDKAWRGFGNRMLFLRYLIGKRWRPGLWNASVKVRVPIMDVVTGSEIST
ncbi:hypothetical protein RU639_003332 [Aspergillus parasiticus]